MKHIAERIKKNLGKVSSLLSSKDFLLNRIESINSENEEIKSWSKFNAFSIIPFYNELTGFKTGDMQYKEPKNKKNVYCYIYDNNSIIKVLSYNSKGNVEDTSYIIRKDSEIIEVRKKTKGDIVAISQIFLDAKNRPIEAYYANDDDNISGYHYFYDGSSINKILTVSNTSPLPYVILSCEYDNESKIKEIYFESDKGKVNVFPR